MKFFRVFADLLWLISYRNTLTRKAAFAPVSVLPLLQDSTETITIETAKIRSNGTPLLRMSTGTAYAYDASVLAWEEVTGSWWAESSPLWTRTRGGTSSKGIVAGLEMSLNESRPDITSAAEVAAGIARPRWWNDALTLGHLETRMYACVLLDSPAEYKAFLSLYAKKLAEEGYKGKAEELIRELHGPIY